MKKRVKKQKQDTFLNNTLDKFTRHKIAMFSFYFLLFEVFLIVFLPIMIDLDPYTSNPGYFSSSPSMDFWLGTDDVGRDVFARLIYGGRVSLCVGFFSAIISAAIGIPLGLLAGYYSGVVRMIIMRLVDIFMSFPAIVIQLVMVTVLGASATSVTLVIGLLGWTKFARYTYS